MKNLSGNGKNRGGVKPFGIAMILTLGMLCAACGNEEKAPQAKATEAATPTEEEVREEPEEALTEEEEEDVQEAASALTEEADMGAAQQNERADEKSGSSTFTFGTQSEDTYENESIGYGCKLPGWSFSDEAALAAMSGYKETLPEDVKDIIDQSPFWMDMFAQAPDAMQNINIQLCNMKKQYGMAVGQDDMEQLFESMLPMLKSTYQQAGATDVNITLGDVKMAGDAFKSIDTTAKISGMNVYIKQIYICRGDYASIVTVTSYQSDKTDEVFTYFYKLD